ncbi:MAG: prepilin peptidase [Leptospirillia bacterium]
MSHFLTMLLAILGGGIWGSFLGVLAVRIPQKISLFWPGSRCDHCGQSLSASELIPFLSWIFLRGRCRTCHHKILIDIPLAEVATALFCLLLLELSPSPVLGMRYLIFFSFALPLTFIDCRHKRLPHLLTIPCMASGILLGGLTHGSHGLLEALLGALAGFVPVALIASLYPRGIGMGDAFWLSAIGSFTGAGALTFVLLIASATGIVGTLILYLTKHQNSHLSLFSLAVPFGPFLSFGGLLTLMIPGISHLFNTTLLETLP